MSENQKQPRSPTFWLCICMIAILISCIGASALQTNFGSVRIIDLNLGTDRQQTLHALMFIPKKASVDNKMPVVITCHGGSNSAEMQDATCIELSRRGVVVIAIDAYNHGMSSNLVEDRGESVQQRVDGMGIVPVVEYVASGILDYVDTSRIAVMGHSMGAGNSVHSIRFYGRQYNDAIEQAKQANSPGGAEITPEEQAYADSLLKIYAGFPTGNVPSRDPAVWEEIHCNIGFLYGLYEEGGASRPNGPILTPASAEALMLVNSIQPEDGQVTSIELGKYYGNKDDGTLRVLYQPEVTHPWIHFSTRATANVIEYFTIVFDLNTSLSMTNQIWNVKEFFNFIGLIAIFVLLIPMAKLLMRIPCFESLVGEEPPKLPALTNKSKKLYWGGFALVGLVSFITAHIAATLSPVIFGSGPSVPRSPFFPAKDFNPVLIWAFLNGIFGLLWFWLIYKKVNSKNGVTDEMIGWKIDKKSLIKTFALSVVIVSLVYAIVALARWAFMTDFRIWTLSLKTFRIDKMLPLIFYLPFFFTFYLANSLLVNGSMRISGMSEKLNVFFCGLGTILGPVLIWAIQYGSALLSPYNKVMWSSWLTYLLISLCIPTLFVATILNRYFFKATGKVWLGAMVNTLILVMMSIMCTHMFGLFL